jgi:hypothetical protein
MRSFALCPWYILPPIGLLWYPGTSHGSRGPETKGRLWFALRDWRGDGLEEYFGQLGAWAEKRLEEIDGYGIIQIWESSIACEKEHRS